MSVLTNGSHERLIFVLTTARTQRTPAFAAELHCLPVRKY